jgi:arylsulfatase A-like enzyme
MRITWGRFISLVLAVLGQAPVVAHAAEKLNVLLIISDDLRPELGCYGSPLGKTPHIDALAASGVRFDRAYCQFPLCNPSRVSMLNSRQPVTTGIIDNRKNFRDTHPEFVSLPQHFKAHGYATLRTGKIFHGGIDDPLAWTEGGDRPGQRPAADDQAERSERGGARALAVQNPPAPAKGKGQGKGRPLTRAESSDRWLVLEGNGENHGDYNTADRAIAFLNKYKDQTFFLACGFAKPHSPPTAPRKYYDLYDPAAIPLPPDFAPRPTVPPGFPRGAIRPRNADLFIGRDATPQAAREMIRAYLASVAWMDRNTGRVLAELDRLGLRDKTVIVFWGDHGYQLGEKGKWSKAGSVWEKGTRVPLIIAAPGARGNGRASSRVVQSIDMYPTLTDLCALPRPVGLEGASLAPLLADPAAPWDRPAYSAWSEDGRHFTAVAVRTEAWRYAEFDGGKGGAMLLDPKADPDELKNLADDPQYQSVRAELSTLVKKYGAGAYAGAAPSPRD